jgi:hypothetical protein
MATGRVYRIKKSAVKGYGYAGPSAKKRAHRRNGSVTHIAAINGRGSYRTARRTMSSLSANRRPMAARSSLSAAKKQAFARKMRGLKQNAKRVRVRRPDSGDGFGRGKRAPSKKSLAALAKYRASLKKNGRRRMRRNDVSPAQERIWERAAKRHSDPWGATTRKKRRAKKKTAPKKKSSRRKAPKKATRKSTMARKVRRRKVGAKRSTPKRRVAKRRTVKRRRKAAKKTAAPKRKRRKSRAKAKKTLKRNRRRLRRNKGTSAGARKGWRARKKKYAPTSYRKRSKRRSTKKRRRSRKASAVAPKRKRRKGKRKLSMKKSAVAARRRRRAKAKGLKPNSRRRRRSRRHTSNSRRRRSHRRHAANPRRRRRSRRMSSNRGHRRSHRRNRRHRKNGRRMFKKNGIGDSLMFIAKTGGIALLGFVGHKVITNLLVDNVMGKIFGSPAAVVATSPTTAAVVAPATSGLGGLSLDPAYQKLIGAGLVAGLGVFASAKLIKDPTTRNTVMTGIAVSFTTSLLTAALMKFAPAHAAMLSGDGTAARLSAMYGLGAGTSLQPRYSSIGRPMGEYFSSGVNGLGEYFDSGVSGLGEYFSSGVSGLGLPAYEAAAGYGANPDFAEAAAGMGARELANTNHVDPHGDLDRELTIAEAAAGVGALPSYEAAAGFGAISTLPTASTWIPGSSNGQIWAGTRSISAPQSATEMVPAGILQTDGGQGVFG